VPLHAEDLYEPLFGLSKEVIMGLPISVNMLFATFAFLMGGVWVDKRGWQSTHLWGVLCLAGGAFLSGIADTVAEFILYRGLMGFGYGLTFMSYMGFVYSNTGENNRTMGFATMSAGMFSGSICGGAVGGMLAERIGYSPVFFVVTALLALALVFPFVFMRHTFQKLGESAHQTKAKVSLRMVFQFLSNRNIFSLLVFLSIPSAITFVGFLYYVSPIYLDRLGTSQANIARILMINGIAMIYLSPMISPMIDRSASKKKFITLSGILGASGLIIFYFIDGLPAIICVIAMLSLSACFGNSSRTVFALQQDVARELGGGQAMSLYRTIDRIGWVLGPMMLGLVIASGNIRMGLSIVGLIYLSLTLLFVFVTREGGLRRASQKR
jgi:predicted MFS family arabinose efflux permease